MFEDHRWGFDWPEFITGIVFLVAAYFVAKQPKAALLSLVFIFAVAALLSGITTFAGLGKLRRDTGMRANFALVFAILDIVVGIIFIMKPTVGLVTLGYLFAFWFIIDSLERLTVASVLRNFGTGYYVLSIILDILGLVMGILLLFNPMIAILSINLLLAIYFAIFGINAILIAFARRD